MALKEPKRTKATLTIELTKSGFDPFVIKFDAANGENLGTGETHPTKGAAEESRKAWLRGMVEVLRAEGCQIIDTAGITD